jgi:hypothetical protein
MPPMRAARIALASACLLAAALIAAGCGGGSDSTATTVSSGETAPSRPAPPAADFPAAAGRSLSEVIETADSPSELIIVPFAQVFYPGPNRYPFGVFQQKAPQITDAEVAVYIAKVPVPGKNSEPGKKGQVAKAETRALDQPALGPFPAKIETLATKPAFRGQTTAEDVDASLVVYSAQIDFPSDGDWRMAAVIKEGEETTATLIQSAEVGEYTKVPRAGERAPAIDTPTAQDVGGDLSKLTTRIPPDDMNQVNYADVLGKEPIVLLFATPKFCQSRVCGPVVDVAQQVKQETGDKAAFIHMEIYNHNNPDAGVRPQVRAFNLPSEPWLFAINREGTISSTVEGPFGTKLMREVVNRVVSE